MRNKIFWMVFLFFGFFGFLQAQNPSILVVDIGLIGDVISRTSRPPGKLYLGVELIAQAPYKLLAADNILSAGVLQKGFNIIEFDAKHLFRQSGIHTYELSLLSGGQELKQPFSLEVEMDVEMEEESEVETQVERLDRKLVLSLYINDKLFATGSKKQVESLAMEFKLPHMPYDYDPNNPDPQSDPMMSSVSILQVVGLAYYFARQLISEEGSDQPPANPLRMKKQITKIFIRKNNLGVEKEVKAVLTLTPSKKEENQSEH